MIVITMSLRHVDRDRGSRGLDPEPSGERPCVRVWLRRGMPSFAVVGNNGGRHQKARQDPRALVIADGEASGDMRQGNIGNRRIKQLHKGCEGDGDGDDPRIYRRPFAGRPGKRIRGSC